MSGKINKNKYIMTQKTSFNTQGYTPPYVKIIEVKSSRSFLQVSNSVDGIPSFSGDNVDSDFGNNWN